MFIATIAVATALATGLGAMMARGRLHCGGLPVWGESPRYCDALCSVGYLSGKVSEEK
ncbi:hypothetical protein ACEUAX_16725 [Aeromonas veronii]